MASHRIAEKMEIIAEGGIASNTRVYGRSVRGKHISHRIDDDDDGDEVSISSNTMDVRFGNTFFFFLSFFSSLFSEKIRNAQMRGTFCEITTRENMSIGILKPDARDLRSSLHTTDQM